MGGKIFDNTSPILKNDVFIVLNDLANFLGDDITCSYLLDSILGSATKKDVSNDIDINFDKESFDLSNIHKKLSVFKHVYKKNMFSVSYPHPYNKEQYTQIDFVLGNYEWQKFIYYSSPNSKYKGLFRNIYLSSIVAEQSLFTLFNGDDMIARYGPTLLFNEGVFWRYRGKSLKNGKRLKTLKEMSSIDFEENFGYKSLIKIPYINTVDCFIDCYFDNTIDQEQLMTIEGVATIFKEMNNHNQQRLDTVTKIFKNKINTLGITIPEGLYDEL